MHSACAVLYWHLWPVWLYRIFPRYLINGTILGKKLLNIKCVFWFCVQLLSETFLIPRRIQRDIIINVDRSSCKVPLFLSDCNETWILLERFSNNPHIPNLMKIRLVRAELFHADGQTWQSYYVIVAFRNYANAPKRSSRNAKVNSIKRKCCAYSDDNGTLCHCTIIATTRNRSRTYCSGVDCLAVPASPTSPVSPGWKEREL
jgi:hypothetical protein